MKNNPELLFSKIVKPAQTILEEYGPDRKVYPLNKILTAFKISKLDYDICNFGAYQKLIQDSELQVQKLRPLLDDHLRQVLKEDGYKTNPDQSFDAIDYLDTTCVRVVTYIGESGADALCYPRAERFHIRPAFQHYHTYKFLERHVHEVGEKEFIGRIPELEPFIIGSGINDNFFWDEVDTSALYEAEEMCERLADFIAEQNIGRENL